MHIYICFLLFTHLRCDFSKLLKWLSHCNCFTEYNSMRLNTALESTNFSGNCVYSEDHRLLQRLNLQTLHNCNSLVWPFGVVCCQAFNIYTIWKKKILNRNGPFFSIYLCWAFPALLCSLEWVPWIILGQVFHCKLAELLDSSVFPVALPSPNPCQPHWRNTAMGCDCDSSNKDHWTFPSAHPARWL